MLRFMPEDIVESTLGILGEPTEAQLCPGLGVEDVPSRPPRAFADWARATRTCSADPGGAPEREGPKRPPGEGWVRGWSRISLRRWSARSSTTLSSAFADRLAPTWADVVEMCRRTASAATGHH